MTASAPFEIPPSWHWVQLHELARVDLGKMLSQKAHDPSLTQRPYLRNQNVRWGTVDLADLKTMGFKSSELERYRVQPGDLLVCEGGEPGRSAIYRGQVEGLMYQKAIHRVRPYGSGLDLSFIRYLLEFYAAWGVALPRMSETTIKHLPREKMLVLPVPVPPEREARRITGRLEETLSKLDAASAGLAEVRKRIDQYRSSVLEAACSGRVVPTEADLARAEGRGYEPASELLARILKERRARWEAGQLAKMTARGKPPKDDSWKKKYVEPEPPDTSELAELPDGWVWATVSAISSLVTDGVHKKPSYVEEGVPFVTVRNLTAGPGIDFSRLRFVTRSDHDVFTKRAAPEIDDILVSKDGTLGVIRRIRTEREFSIFVSVALVKPVERALSPYLELALSSPQVQSQMVPKGSGLQHIHLEDLRRDCVPVPPLAEQARIVEEVERRLSIADQADATIASALARAQRLRQTILRRAFEGKLVPQDPNDEPAAVLLERIRKAREVVAAEGSPTGRRRRVTGSVTVSVENAAGPNAAARGRRRGRKTRR